MSSTLQSLVLSFRLVHVTTQEMCLDNVEWSTDSIVVQDDPPVYERVSSPDYKSLLLLHRFQSWSCKTEVPGH